MAVYNGQDYLSEAIGSILNQTYKDFEFLVVDDGSTDQSAKIIKEYKDKRLKYIHQKNQGLAAALNNGVALAKGNYIARQDADDISYPNRLKEQLEFLETHHDVALLGSCFDIINVNSEIVGRSYHLDRNQDIQTEFLLRNPFGHGTVMVRKSVLQEVGGYDGKQEIEDYELWWRIAKSYKVANLPESLYAWRVSPQGISHGGSQKRQLPLSVLMQQIWSEAQIPEISFSRVSTGVKHYSKLGFDYRQQYLFMLSSVVVGMFKMGYKISSLVSFFNLVLASPGVLRIMLQLYKNPQSYFYNLSNLSKY